MSLVKKSDVKNHLSARHHSGIHLVPPLSQREATNCQADEPVRVHSNVEEQPDPASSIGVEELPPVIESESSYAVMAAVSRRPKT